MLNGTPPLVAARAARRCRVTTLLNIYLFCASEGLNVVVRGMVDKPALALKLNLRPDQRIRLAQTIGFPRKPRM